MAKVFIRHTRGLGMCCSGVKSWFEKKGLDYRSFLTEGVDEELLLATNDAMAEKAVEFMRKEENENKEL